MLEKIKKKLLDGNLDVNDWKAIEAAKREQILLEALCEAVKVADQAWSSGERVDGGLLITLPGDAAGMALPPGYALAETGVYRIVLSEENGKVKASATRLTQTPFLCAARDIGGGKVKLLVLLQGTWRSEWVAPSRITTAKLMDWFIFPEPGVKPAALVDYARACTAVAPFVVSEDIIAQAAVEILQELFPTRAVGVTFPALRDFPAVRQKAEARGVDPLAVRRWWERQGFILEGPGKVVRQGSATARVLAFTRKVREFLEALPEDSKPRAEGKIFRIRFLSGPDAGQEKLVALPGAPVVPLGALTPSPLSPLAQVLAGPHWPGEVVEVRGPEQYNIQILEIDPPLNQQDGHQKAQAG